MTNNLTIKVNEVMDYLYADELYALPKCPPARAKPTKMIAWRWTFSPHTDKCFSPVAVLEPKRVLTGSDSTKCSCWALSMFESQNAAVARMQELDSLIPNFKPTKGDHVSQVNLTEIDGVATPPDARGHFDFHPCKSFDLKSNSKVIGPIP